MHRRHSQQGIYERITKLLSSVRGIVKLSDGGKYIDYLERIFYESTHDAFKNYDKTQMGAGQLLENVKVYALSPSKPTAEGLFWRWSEGRGEPIIWEQES